MNGFGDAILALYELAAPEDQASVRAAQTTAFMPVLRNHESANATRTALNGTSTKTIILQQACKLAWTRIKP